MVKIKRKVALEPKEFLKYLLKKRRNNSRVKRLYE